jgi:hypothetical protein
MEDTIINFAGNVKEPFALDMEIFPSSMGCLKTSSTLLGNSGISSKNKTPARQAALYLLAL